MSDKYAINFNDELSPDTLILTVESSGATRKFKKSEVHVGRDFSNDYALAKCRRVSRRHATFLYDHQMWFLTDNYSANGTFINGSRLEPDRAYPLVEDDKISFADQETVIFHCTQQDHANDVPEVKAPEIPVTSKVAAKKSRRRNKAASQDEVIPDVKGSSEKRLSKRNAEQNVNGKVKAIYDGMNTEYRDKVFYGGVISADRILTELSRSVFGKVNDSNVDLCFQIYLRTWVHSRMDMPSELRSPAYIRKVMCARFSELDPNVIAKCVEKSLDEIYRHEPKLKKRTVTNMAAPTIPDNNVQKNISVENLYLNDQAYGLVPEKPVFVNGFENAKAYLSHLYTEDGTKLGFQRMGSLSANGISGPVDLYNLLLPDGTKYLDIFICNYGSCLRKIGPKGTTFVD